MTIDIKEILKNQDPRLPEKIYVQCACIELDLDDMFNDKTSKDVINSISQKANSKSLKIGHHIIFRTEEACYNGGTLVYMDTYRLEDKEEFKKRQLAVEQEKAAILAQQQKKLERAVKKEQKERQVYERLHAKYGISEDPTP